MELLDERNKSVFSGLVSLIEVKIKLETCMVYADNGYYAAITQQEIHHNEGRIMFLY